MQTLVERRERHPEQDTIIDLCAGYQSLKPLALKYGFNYIAVDVLGDRNLRRTASGKPATPTYPPATLTVASNADQVPQPETDAMVQASHAISRRSTASNCAGCNRAVRSTRLDRQCEEQLGMMEKPPHGHCHQCGATAREEVYQQCPCH